MRLLCMLWTPSLHVHHVPCYQFCLPAASSKPGHSSLPPNYNAGRRPQRPTIGFPCMRLAFESESFEREGWRGHLYCWWGWQQKSPVLDVVIKVMERWNQEQKAPQGVISAAWLSLQLLRPSARVCFSSPPSNSEHHTWALKNSL